MRTVVKVVAAVAAIAVALVVALALLLQTGAVSNRVKDLVLPRASAALGREVTVRDARVHLFPPSVALLGARVAGRPGEPPLAELEALDVSVALGPLVTSLGRDVRVQGLTLVKPTLNLVRARDGTWNYEGLGGEGAREERAPAPPGAARRSFVASSAAIEDGTVRLVDHTGGATVAISKIDVRASGGIGRDAA